MSQTRKAHECPHCWLVYYSKGALTNHINAERWDLQEAKSWNAPV